MTTVKEFLGNVRDSIFAEDKNYQRLELPPVTKVWQDDNNPNTDLPEAELFEQFCQNLEKVSGEFVLCDDFANLVFQIAKILREQKSDEIKIMVSSNPATRQVADELQAVVDGLTGVDGGKLRLKFYFEPTEELELEELAGCDIGLVSAESLLADTGSGIFRASSRFERLAVYLPPISVVVADRGKLAKNLQTAWQNLCTEIKNQKTGEFVIVTGPSRTADIEKILILGVHGPKRVLFMIYPNKT
ncbi:MAG: lactate utilization protein [Planctomycetaceae bacterium]|jgi:L-lactate dehydrogenase complex protein LldG|nr:lactate utilization protein [Planctomycetaceae bacterium]